MAQFRSKQIVEATQWFKNGDHPNDNCFRPYEDTGTIPRVSREGEIVRYFRHPKVDGTSVCPECGKTMHEHGLIDVNQLRSLGYAGAGGPVCPGMWVVTEPSGWIFTETVRRFEEAYEPI
jgi:hypothetical protein